MITKISVILYCVILLACSSGSKPITNPTLLVSRINSYISPDQVKKLVKADSKQWRIIEDNKTSEDDKRPPFHLLIIEVTDFEDLGEHGKAKFCFYNNRLMSVLFYPFDLGKYISKLENEKGISFGSKSEILTSKNTKISIGKDSTGKASYVEFEDVALEKELNDWISRYS